MSFNVAHTVNFKVQISEVIKIVCQRAGVDILWHWKRTIRNHLAKSLAALDYIILAESVERLNNIGSTVSHLLSRQSNQYTNKECTHYI